MRACEGSLSAKILRWKLKCIAKYQWFSKIKISRFEENTNVKPPVSWDFFHASDVEKLFLREFEKMTKQPRKELSLSYCIFLSQRVAVFVHENFLKQHLVKIKQNLRKIDQNLMKISQNFGNNLSESQFSIFCSDMPVISQT